MLFERFKAHEGQNGVYLVFDIYLYIVFESFDVEYLVEVDLNQAVFAFYKYRLRRCGLW